MLQKIFRRRWFNHSLLLFLLLQPFLDVITSLTLRLTESDFTIGLFIRFAFMIICASYLFLFKDNPFRKNQIIYFSLLALLFSINLASSYMFKPNFSLVAEVKLLLKLGYFTMMVSVYITMYKTTEKYKWVDKTISYMVLAITLIGLIMVVSVLTGTAFDSYRGGKMGHVGWFFAGNELGAILSIGFPIVVLAALKKSNYYWIPVILSIYSLLSLGTKVGFATVLLVLGIGMLFTTYDFFVNKKGVNKLKFPFANIGMLFTILIGVMVYTPYSPIAYNMNVHFNLLGIGELASEETDEKDQKKPEEDVTNEQVENLIYSGRENFLTQHKEYFKDAPLIQKYFGLGYGGNYTGQAKMIEMDFHDIFFSLGYIGSIFFFAPFIYYLSVILFKLLSHFKQLFNSENILIASGIALGLGIAAIAGHTITAPAVSIYLAVLIAYLQTKLREQ